jgi:hypothetical protein
MELTPTPNYDLLLQVISTTLRTGQSQAVRAANVHLLETYWRIGQHIVEFEQGGQSKAEYGTGLITRLAKDLRQRHGKGFDRSNLIRMRQFYIAYPKGATLSHFLSWSHVVELLKIDNQLERSFSKPCELALRRTCTVIRVWNGQGCKPGWKPSQTSCGRCMKWKEPVVNRMWLAMIKRRANTSSMIVQQKVPKAAEVSVTTVKVGRQGKRSNRKITPLIWQPLRALSF